MALKAPSSTLSPASGTSLARVSVLRMTNSWTMVPALVTLKITVPAGAEVALSSILYSVSVPVIVVVVVLVAVLLAVGDEPAVELQAANATATPTRTSVLLWVFMSTCLIHGMSGRSGAAVMAAILGAAPWSGMGQTARQCGPYFVV